MVVSNLDDSIIYQNIKSVDNSDLGFDASLYEIIFICLDLMAFLNYTQKCHFI
jgi:hypothetical protein